jgi:hypothetical protein
MDAAEHADSEEARSDDRAVASAARRDSAFRGEKLPCLSRDGLDAVTSSQNLLGADRLEAHGRGTLNGRTGSDSSREPKRSSREARHDDIEHRAFRIAWDGRNF